MAKIKVNRVEINCEQEGTKGPVVAFLPGVWMTGRYFQKQTPHFAQTCQTMVIDHRGHGRSEHVHRGHTVAQYARDLHAVFETTGVRDVVVVGWSMGGLVLWDYVRQFGTDRLRGAVIVDQGPSDYRWPDWPHGPFDFTTLRGAMDAVQSDQQTFVRGFIPSMFAQTPSPEELAWMTEESSNMPASVASAILFDQTVQDYRAVLPKMTLPVLFCRGAHDRYLSQEAAEYTVGQMPNAKLEIFSQSSHCPFYEEPAKFNAAVDAFIRSL